MKDKKISQSRPTQHGIVLFLTSLSLLSYEILLMRLMSIAWWHHFASMIISMALLGLGVSGSLLFLAWNRIRKRPDPWILSLACLTALSLTFSFPLSQRLGLDPLMLVWRMDQWFRMLFSYLVMALPFLFGGGIVGIILSSAGKRIHRMYAADLMGAGVGAMIVVPALYVAPPWIIVPGSGILLLIGASFCLARTGSRTTGLTAILVASALIIAGSWVWPPRPRMHHTKGLPMTLSLPDARVEAQKTGPLGLVHVVGSRSIRHVPGLSLNFGLQDKEGGGVLPEQKAIFVDGDGLSPIAKDKGLPEESAYLDYTTQSLPYHIRKPKQVLVIGAGGGSDVLMGLRHQASNITALEANGQIAELLLESFAHFSGDLYRRPQVSLEVKEARRFLKETEDVYDLIHLSLTDSFASSAGGLHSAHESYLYTREAFRSYLDHLSPTGIVAITRWLKLPPRDSFRILSTAVSALRETNGVLRYQAHLLFIRSWKTATILVSKAPFMVQDIDRMKAFCRLRSFDIAYYEGMGPEEANRYDIQGAPVYFQGTKALCSEESEAFIGQYVFDISPTTDDRPYFSHFFRWDRVLTFYRQLKRDWLPLVDAGYIFVIAALLQVIPASTAFILVPLLFLRKVQTGDRGNGGRAGPGSVIMILVYFGSVGLAFMFLEMSLLPKYTLVLSHPVYAAAVVLSTILIFAGVGSGSVRWFMGRGAYAVWMPFLFISSWTLFQAFPGQDLWARAAAWPLGPRFLYITLSLSILAFFMGRPFPTGLEAIAEKYPALVPWAWGINGCASVVGAVLGKCLAMGIGFRGTMFTACGFYLVAALCLRVLRRT